MLIIAYKCTKMYHFGDKNDIFSGEGPSYLHHTPPPWRITLSLLKSQICHWVPNGCFKNCRPGTLPEQVDDGVVFDVSDGSVATYINGIEICSVIHQETCNCQPRLVGQRRRQLQTDLVYITASHTASWFNSVIQTQTKTTEMTSWGRLASW